MRYLAVRIVDQQHVIANVVTVDSEQRPGTTPPRISWFVQWIHNLGLIETNEVGFLIIKATKLTDYLAQIA